MSINIYMKQLTERGVYLCIFHLEKYLLWTCSSNSSVVERDENFDPNHWQSELSLEEIREIEENCELVMTTLDYSKYNESEREDHS